MSKSRVLSPGSRVTLAGQFADLAGLAFREDRRLSQVTTYRIGGEAGLLCEPETPGAFAAALQRCARRNLPVRFLGGGSNLLVADAGFPGVVLRTRRLRGLGHDTDKPALVYSDAGVGLARLVGGAVYMNAGGRHGEIADLLVSVMTAGRAGTLRHRHPSELGFAYRTARLGGDAVLGVTLRCSLTSPEESHGRMRAILREKGLTQPLRARSAGCVFKNPGPKSAGWLIDRAGCKGLRVGGAMVSPRHANFFVNVEHASASVVLVLASRVRARVHERFGVLLEPELQLWSDPAREAGPFAA